MEVGFGIKQLKQHTTLNNNDHTFFSFHICIYIMHLEVARVGP